MNKKSIKFAREMYQAQRADALSDWERQNEYNSPTAQMARFRDAGLNPALIYGQSNTADAVRSSDFKQPQLRAANYDSLANVPGQFFDARIKEAQTDNLRKSNTVLDQEILLKAAQVNKTLADTDQTKFNTALAISLKDTTLAAAQANVESIMASTDKTNTEKQISLNRDQREAVMNSSNLIEAKERIKQIQLQQAKTAEETRNIKKDFESKELDQQLKKVELMLKEKGVYPGDPMWLRVLLQNLPSVKWDGPPKDTTDFRKTLPPGATLQRNGNN